MKIEELCVLTCSCRSLRYELMSSLRLGAEYLEEEGALLYSYAHALQKRSSVIHFIWCGAMYKVVSIPLQCNVHAPVAIRCQGHMIAPLHDHLAVKCQARKLPLPQQSSNRDMLHLSLAALCPAAISCNSDSSQGYTCVKKQTWERSRPK